LCADIAKGNEISSIQTAMKANKKIYKLISSMQLKIYD